MDQFPAVFRWVLQTSLMASVLTIIILLMKYVLRNRLGIQWHYAVWFIVIIRLLLPYAPQSPVSIFNFFAAIHSEITGKEIQSQMLNMQFSRDSIMYGRIAGSPGNEKQNKTDSTEKHLKEEAETQRQPQSQREQEFLIQSQGNIPIQSQENSSAIQEAVKNKRMLSGATMGWILNLQIYQVIYYLWLVGVVLLGFYMLAVNIKFRQHLKREKTTVEDGVIQILKECKNLLKIRQRVEVMYTDFAKVPALFGFMAPKILFPNSMKQSITDSEMKCIFLHELAHLKRKDIIINWLTTVLQIIHWFNPIIWLAFSKMREDREIACDATVLYYLQEDEMKKYGETLISILGKYGASVKLSGVTGIIESKSQVKRRIKMIAGFNEKRYKWSLAAILVLVFMGCSMLTNPNNVENVKNSDNQINNEIDLETTVLADTVSEDNLENWFIKAGYITRQGEWVYFYGLPLDREGGNYSLTSGPIYRIKLDGTGKTKVVDGNVEYVGIYEDWLYYKEGDGLYRINTENGEKTLLTQDAHGSIAIDGGWIFIATQNGIVRMSCDGQEKGQLVEDYVRDIIAHDGWVYYTTDDSLNRISIDGTQRSVLVKGTVGKIGIWEDKLYYSLVFEKAKVFQPEDFYEGVLIWIYDVPYIILDADVYRMNLDGTEEERIADGNLAKVINGWVISYLYEDEIGWVIANVKQIGVDVEYRHWLKFLQEIWVRGVGYNNVGMFYREIKIDDKWIYQCNKDGLIVMAISDESKAFRIRQTETGIFYEHYNKPRF